jgi:hypothetical protein
MALLAEALDCNLNDLLSLWKPADVSVWFRAEDVRRAQARAVLGAVLTTRQPAPRRQRS